MTNKEIKPPVDKNNPNYYVSKQEMYDALVEYQQRVREAIAENKEPPKVSNYLGECFLLIARGMASKHNFRNYSYIEDMIMNGVEMCLKRIMSFDPAQPTKNPFWYFSRVVWYEFIGTIQAEKSQQERKKNLLLSMDVDTFTTLEGEESDFGISLSEYLQTINLDSTPYVPKVKKETPKKEKPDPLAGIFE